jgi:hypothetical protein
MTIPAAVLASCGQRPCVTHRAGLGLTRLLAAPGTLPVYVGEGVLDAFFGTSARAALIDTSACRTHDGALLSRTADSSPRAARRLAVKPRVRAGFLPCHTFL